MTSPLLSVVVTIVDGGEALDRCLRALVQQEAPPRLEIIVPYDASVAEVSRLADRYPRATFLNMGAVPTERAVLSAAGQHELFDRRRAAGISAAKGDLIAILEDRGVPRPDWARQAVELHAALPHAVIGGAIENGRDRPLNWAVYFCDFGRYQLPFSEGARAYVSDVNICYKRRALEATRGLWTTRYHETTVHWALQRSGETLYLHPHLVVDQVRGTLRFGALLRERLGWGRLFAHTRARELPRFRRLTLLIVTPVLPVVLLFRIVRGRFQRRRDLSRLALTWPSVLALLAAWCLGEAAGYATGKP